MAPPPRSASSAGASRSAVLMPGVTAAFSFSRVRPTTSPASRISAISSSVLIWINALPLLYAAAIIPAASAAVGTQCSQCPFCDVVDRTHRVDAHEDTGLGVVAHQRRGLLVIDLE